MLCILSANKKSHLRMMRESDREREDLMLFVFKRGGKKKSKRRVEGRARELRDPYHC